MWMQDRRKSEEKRQEASARFSSHTFVHISNKADGVDLIGNQLFSGQEDG